MYDKKTKQHYALNEIVFSKSLNDFVKVKKFDKEKLIVFCKQEGVEKEHELSQSDLTILIDVSVKLASL